MSYNEYRTLMDELASTGATTGPDQSDELINYTMLNARRYKRWEKTLKMDEASQDALDGQSLPDMTWLVLTESWCGDAAHLMPVMKLLSERMENTEIKVLERDKNLELMDCYLTNGSRSIPKLIAVDSNSGEPLFTYGPRPSVATQLVDEFKAEHGKLTAEFKEDLQRWYNKDKGQTAIKDLLEELDSL